ncbi:ATP-dependent RNA helicase DDX25 isoform X2 [Microcebus murinus]|uniref:ATP-dependent RNA helicase DDX25 isoform X2 n=1 Tax=Microcebus murinus TaxID=30608 RepID=UPI000642D0F8|nr:ATP-dependent RNA helicase DDX25 isoform X2 [Microcebus murinus]
MASLLWGGDAGAARSERLSSHFSNPIHPRKNLRGIKSTTVPNVDGSVNTEEEDEEDVVDLAANSLLNKLIRQSLVESSHRVEVLQKDPSSPLYSVKTFEELRLKEELLKGIYAMGFNRPSKIQEMALPMMLAHPPQNLIAQSQSGTGKTAAFVLAMLSRVNVLELFPQLKLKDGSSEPFFSPLILYLWQCLCLAPTYELALQTGRVVEQMGKFCVDVQVMYAIRGNRNWCFKRKLIDLTKIHVFVLDEADVMIDTQGFSDQSIRIQRALPTECQMLLFSATFEDSVWQFAERIIPDPNVIKLRKEELTLNNIRQYYVLCENRKDKYQALCNIYGGITIGQAIIFCQTRRNAKWLTVEMMQDGHQVSLLSGELTVEQRASIIQRFRDGKEKVLITTNVCARGIDVKQVTIVVNFDLPVNQAQEPDYETYLHRIGRTGRFGKKGLAFNMIEVDKLPLLMKIQDHFNSSIKQLDPEDMDEIEKIEY